MASLGWLLPEGALGWSGALLALGLICLLYESPADRPAAQPAGAPADDLSEATCRVCYAGPESGRLFSPCRCTGSMRFVHVHCLNTWRTASANPRSFFSCDQCGYSYQTRRTRVAALLQSDKFVWVVSWVLVLLMVVCASLVPGHPERFFYELTSWWPQEEFAQGLMWPTIRSFPPTSLSDFQMKPLRWEPWCDRVIAGLFLPAMLGLAHVIFKRFGTGGNAADGLFVALGISQFILMGGLSPALLVPCLIYCWAKLVDFLAPLTKKSPPCNDLWQWFNSAKLFWRYDRIEVPQEHLIKHETKEHIRRGR